MPQNSRLLSVRIAAEDDGARRVRHFRTLGNFCQEVLHFESGLRAARLREAFCKSYGDIVILEGNAN